MAKLARVRAEGEKIVQICVSDKIKANKHRITCHEKKKEEQQVQR